MKSQRKPAYAVISADGSRYTIVYKAQKSKHSTTLITGQIQGYSIETFKGLDSSVKIIDWRNADFSAAFQHAIRGPKPAISDYRSTGVTLKEYFKSAESAGAQIVDINQL